MSLQDKSKAYLAIPLLNPDKIIGDPITGSFATTNSASSGFGAAYDGVHTITNPAGKLAFPISRYTENGTDYYTDRDQTPDGSIQNVVVITAVTATQIKYRWAANSSPHTITYETILISME